MTTDADGTRRTNTAALRALHRLERALQTPIVDLHEIDCDDLEAAEAIVFAIEGAEKALANARAIRREQSCD